MVSALFVANQDRGKLKPIVLGIATIQFLVKEGEEKFIKDQGAVG